jgi:Ca2+-binding RTX toxin-like protein
MPNTPVTWRDQFVVNTTTVNAQFDPDVIQLANGNILVSWTTNDAGGLGSPNGNETFAQIFDPGGNKIGGEIRLNNASTGGDEQNADLAALPDGGFLVVYHDLDNPPSVPAGGSNIRLEEFDASGNQVTENAAVVIDSGTGGDPNYRNPRVAVSSATSALVVYEEFTASGTRIVGKIYNPVTDSYGSQLTLINASGLVDAVPDVAVLSNGNYVIAATYLQGTDSAINYTIISSTGGGVKSPTFITGTSGDGEGDREVSITALAGGGFVIAWTNADANDTDVLFRVYDNAGTQIGSGSPGDNSATNNNNESKVIALADGTFVVAWDNDEAVGINVQHYNATGGLLGTAFVVSADNVNNISGFGLADGRFALVWDVSGAEISMKILDTRDGSNNPGVYSPDQWIVGNVAAETITLDATTEHAAGGLGDDILIGNASANILDGGEGLDNMAGGAGDDTYVLDVAGDTTLEGVNAGNDTTRASITHALRANIENLVLTGTANINGTGNALNNEITGNTGNNILNGLAGADAMFGLAGNDTYHVDNTGDAVRELASSGIDIVRSTATFTIADSVENLYILGSAISATGNAQSNFIYGNANSSVIDGRGGADRMFGTEGNDTFIVDSTGDLIFETAAGSAGGTDTVHSSVNHTLATNVERLSLTGIGNVNATGNTLVNLIIGNSGNNFIDGKLGSDNLTGGLGLDNFVFTTALGAANVDTITDFTVADDTLRLDDGVFAALPLGFLAASAFHIGAAAADVSDRIIYNAATDAIFYDPDGVGGVAQVRFANLAPGLALTNADVFVF